MITVKHFFTMTALLIAALLAVGYSTTNGQIIDKDLEPPVIDDAIFRAVVRQIYTVEHSFGESPNWPLVYVVNVTNENLGVPDVPSTEPQKLSETLQADIAAGLDDLPAEVIWIDSSEDVSTAPTTGVVDGGDGIIITFGNMHEQDDGSVLVPYWRSCNLFNFCGMGGIYVVEEVDGVWQVTGTTGPFMIA